MLTWDGDVLLQGGHHYGRCPLLHHHNLDTHPAMSPPDAISVFLSKDLTLHFNRTHACAARQT